MADLAAAISTEVADGGGFDPAAAASSATHVNVFARHGCERMLTLLKGLEAMFPEKETLTGWIVIFENMCLGDPEKEVSVMTRWHTEMTTNPDGSKRVPSLYVKTRERDIDHLLDSGVWVLDEIDARAMYNDPYVEDEDRETICQHFDKINSCAEAMHAVPSDMLESIMSCMSSVDTTQPITAETTFAVLQKVIGCKPEDLAHNTDAMERLIGWSQQLIEGMSNGGLEALQSIAGEASLAAGTGMPDLSAITSMLQSEIMGSTSILSTSEDGIDDTKVSALASMFSSMSA